MGAQTKNPQVFFRDEGTVPKGRLRGKNTPSDISETMQKNTTLGHLEDNFRVGGFWRPENAFGLMFSQDIFLSPVASRPGAEPAKAFAI